MVRHVRSDAVREETSKRSTILGTAAALFSAYGYHAVGVDKIIADSGVAKMTMYRHFPSKDTLVLEVLQKQMEGVRSALEDATFGRKTMVAKLKAIFDWHDEWFNSPSFHGCMFMRAASEYNAHDSEIRQVADDQKRDLIDIIHNIMREGGLRAAKAKRLASALVMILDGAIISAEVSGNRKAAPEAWAIAKTLLEFEG
jgi:AcrR family transcriptional regulator